MKNWTITKWCKSITDSKEDEYTKRTIEATEKIHFRLLDDDGIVYAYGVINKEWFDDDNENGFIPLDYYMSDYGCTEIQLKNEVTGVYETL